MTIDRASFIFGRPIDTNLGQVKFLTFPQYIDYSGDVSSIGLNVLHIYYRFKKLYEANKMDSKELEELKSMTLHEIITSSPEFRDSYTKVFGLVMDSDAVIEVMENPNKFMEYRKLVMDMNLVTEEDVSPNSEIQEGIEMSRKINQQKGEKQSFEDIVTSIVAATSNSFEDVRKMTVYQVYSIYARVGAIFNYTTSTLFATVSEQKIESWGKHIDLLNNENSTNIKRSDFDKKFGELL